MIGNWYAVLAPRGMLKFHAEPQTPYDLDAVSTERRLIVSRAAGPRSALDARTLQEFGYTDVAPPRWWAQGLAADGRPVVPPNPG